MSHFRERVEKVCLNCNAALDGRYCHVCGQENISPKETAWHLFTHFFNDITHFDGKFFKTLKLLVARPGFLSKEYAFGRRARYLNPIRMYIFTSALFFLVFFSYMQPRNLLKDKNESTVSVIQELEEAKQKLNNQLAIATDSSMVAELETSLQNTIDDINLMKQDSTNIDSLKTYPMNGITTKATGYQSLSMYDSVQLSLIPGERDGYFKTKLQRLSLNLVEKYKKEGFSIIRVIIDKFLHHLPKLLFISLPLFALILKLLYFRRKTFYYVNHFIFTLHFYIFTFIAFLVIFLFSSLNSWLHWRILDLLNSLLSFSIFFYLYKSMRNFYDQSTIKTFTKFFLLNVLFTVVLGFLFFIFLFYSLFEV